MNLKCQKSIIRLQPHCPDMLADGKLPNCPGKTPLIGAERLEDRVERWWDGRGRKDGEKFRALIPMVVIQMPERK